MQYRRARQLRSGFTLVELLIVIAIITALVALLLVGIWGAFATAKDARILVEISNLNDAMEAYRAKYGEYPPVRVPGESGSMAQARVRRHLLKAFPRHVPTNGEVNTLANLDAAESLVFWLGGIPVNDGNGGFNLEGFCADVSNPLQSSYAGGTCYGKMASGQNNNPSAQQRLEAFYQFKPDRLRNEDGDAFPAYMPPELNSPYLYFKFDTYVLAASNGQGYKSRFNSSIAMPYCIKSGNLNSPSTWAMPKSFQIICGGLDDNYGSTSSARVYTTGQNFDQSGADDDNLTNFLSTRLGKERE